MVAISNFHLGPLTRKAARPQWVRDHPRAPWAAVAAVCLGAFMGQRDASIVTLTYPRLQSEFATRLGSVAWVSLSYLVVLAVLLVPWVGGRTREDESCCTCMDSGCSPSPQRGVLWRRPWAGSWPGAGSKPLGPRSYRPTAWPWSCSVSPDPEYGPRSDFREPHRHLAWRWDPPWVEGWWMPTAGGRCSG